MTKAAVVAAVALTLLSCFSAPRESMAADGAEIILSTSTVEPFNRHDSQGFLDRVIAEAFARSGRDARVAIYPKASARALMLADQGLDDGVALRIGGLATRYPNLIQVPEPIMVNEFVAYTAPSSDIEIGDWDDLTPYSVGYILGWAIFEKNVAAAETTAAGDADQLFNLLERGRADVVLYERWQGLALAEQRRVPVTVHEPPLATVNMYIYLHRKHAAIANDVAAALKSMKADGTYERIAAQTLYPLMPAGQ